MSCVKYSWKGRVKFNDEDPGVRLMGLNLVSHEGL